MIFIVKGRVRVGSQDALAVAFTAHRCLHALAHAWNLFLLLKLFCLKVNSLTHLDKLQKELGIVCNLKGRERLTIE